MFRSWRSLVHVASPSPSTVPADGPAELNVVACRDRGVDEQRGKACPLLAPRVVLKHTMALPETQRAGSVRRLGRPATGRREPSGFGCDDNCLSFLFLVCDDNSHKGLHGSICNDGERWDQAGVCGARDTTAFCVRSSQTKGASLRCDLQQAKPTLERIDLWRRRLGNHNERKHCHVQDAHHVVRHR